MKFDMFQPLRDRGWQGKGLALRMGVVGDGKIRRVSSYSSASQSAISAQCDILQASGFAGIVQVWNGAGVPFNHRSMMRTWAECQSRGMSFAVMLDQWVAKGKADPTQAVVDALASDDFQLVLNSKAYLPERYVLEFDIATSALVDVNAVRRAFPVGTILSEDSGYSWPKVADTKLNYQKAMASPSMKMPHLCLGFFDGGWPLPAGVDSGPKFSGRDWDFSVWNPKTKTRVIEHQAGYYLIDQMGDFNVKCPYALWATLDDHEEGTAIEQFLSAATGIWIK